MSSMQPRLFAIAGPLQGTTIPLVGKETVIGRDSTNGIALNDPLVSRRHCSIRNGGGAEIQVSDLDSLNGTFVNGEPLREKTLEHGDRLKVGISQFVFLIRDENEEDNQTRVRLSDSPHGVLTAVTMEIGPPNIQAAKDLAALLRISTEVNGIKNPEELQKRVLEMLFESLPVERAAILLCGQNHEEWSSGIYRRHSKDQKESFRISRTVVRKALDDGVALMAKDVLNDEHFDHAESLMASQIRSLLCVPLTVFGSKLGVIYADSTRPDAGLDEHHLRLLTAIASVTAVALEHVRYVEWLEGENKRLQAEIEIEHDMIGDSAPMRQVYGFIQRVAGTDSTVLIRGESGTGKELVARALHSNSKRAGRPFVAINCAALTMELLESELFGHVRGAFTGAFADKKGKIEIADGGTLFLDEVGELALPLQAKLLRALQERQFERVGGNRAIKVDIRLIAATNRDLEEAVAEKAFRPDLYYRLNVVAFTLPPLRERRDDVPLLTKYFVTKYSLAVNRGVLGVSPEAYALLRQYDWPGNVRELQNALERAVVLGAGDLIRPEDLPEALVETREPSQAGVMRYHDAVNTLKRELILKAIEQAGGNFTEAAKLLDVHPNYLHRLVRNMDLRKFVRF